MPPLADPVQRPGALPHPMPVRFTGSGSEYFRIWIVNLLLTLFTLGIYLPWAKVRRLKYFHGNTLVGDAPLGFHGNPRQMLRGHLLAGLLVVLYSVAGQVSQLAGLLALAIVTAIGPALFKAALEFRLANTSWRGLRLRFTGGLREAYVLLAPVVAMVFVMVAFFAFADFSRGQAIGLAVSAVLLVLLLGWLLAWSLRETKRYQHTHYALGSVQTGFTAQRSHFAALLLRTAGLALLLLAVAGAAVFGLVSLRGRPETTSLRVLSSLVPLLIVLVAFVMLKPYFIARLQNLVWNHTTSETVQFHSDLRVRPMLWQTLKNWLLILCTLGLYWPFAAIAMARLRLQALSLTTRDDPDTLVAALRQDPGTAAGDAAGDLFGLDVGL